MNLRQAIFCVLLAFTIPGVTLQQSIAQEIPGWNVYYESARWYIGESDHDNAVYWLKKAKALLEEDRSGEERDSCYVLVTGDLGTCYFNLGKYDEALEYSREALDLAGTSLGKEHIYYPILLNNMGDLYQKLGMYEETVPLFVEFQEITERLYGSESVVYLYGLVDLADVYQLMGEYRKAGALYAEVLANKEKLPGSNILDYVSFLNNTAEFYRLTGAYTAALTLQQEAVDYTIEYLGYNHPYYPVYIHQLAAIYQDMGNYSKAMPLYLEAEDYAGRTIGKDHPDYAHFLSSLADLYMDMGQYGQALSLALRSLDHKKRNYSADHPTIASSQVNLASVYQAMGQYGEAFNLYVQGLETLRRSIGTSHPYYAAAQNNLAEMLRQMGEYSEALPLYKEALENAEASMGKDHFAYGVALHNLAQLYRDMKRHEQAEPLYLEARENLITAKGADHPDHGTFTANLADLYLEMERFGEAEALYKEAMQIIERSLGDNHLSYNVCASNLADLYRLTGRFDMAVPLYMSTSEKLRRHINHQFDFMTEAEKLKYLKTLSLNFMFYQSFTRKHHHQFRELVPFIYENELMLKGLILGRSVAVRKNVMDEEMSGVSDTYESWQQLRAYIANQQSLPIQDRDPLLDSLSAHANTLERDMVMHSSTFGKSLEQRDISWQSVRDALEPSAAAIEFIRFHHYEKGWTDTVYYAALLIMHDTEQPVWIDLFEEGQLDQLLIRATRFLNKAMKTDYLYSRSGFEDLSNADETYSDAGLYDLVWKPLEPYLQNVKTIYYSPAGQLHNIAIPALQKNDSLLLDRYDLFSMSSTRQLVFRENRTGGASGKNAVVFGGIRYELSTSELQASAKEIVSGPEYAGRAVKIPEDGSRGVTWNYLPGAEEESAYITDRLNDMGLEVRYFTDAAATEGSFKELSGNSPDILHVSTHGFFFPDPELDKNSMHSMQTGEDLARHSKDPLLRSGLVLAGANYAWSGGERLEGVEDGILTAYEISNMDLSGTELVVLSACETGLGEIRGSEGVFGLQRAFKMAGADYLIMSLWQVLDLETAEFMKRFYDLWLVGEPIREAFNRTQREMAAKYAGEPYKWAAFILVE